MTFVDSAEYDWDIFISYAHVNNIARDRDELAFTDQFVKDLENELRQALGGPRHLAIKYDRSLQSNEDFDESLLGAAERSAALLMLISEAYVNRADHPYCALECERFAAKGTLKAGPMFRVLKAKIRPVAPGSEPFAELRITPVEFYEATPTGVRPFRRSLSNDPDQRYWDCIRRLANDLAALLRYMKGAPASEVSAAAQTSGDAMRQVPFVAAPVNEPSPITDAETKTPVSQDHAEAKPRTRWRLTRVKQPLLIFLRVALPIGSLLFAFWNLWRFTLGMPVLEALATAPRGTVANFTVGFMACILLWVGVSAALRSFFGLQRAWLWTRYFRPGWVLLLLFAMSALLFRNNSVPMQPMVRAYANKWAFASETVSAGSTIFARLRADRVRWWAEVESRVFKLHVYDPLTPELTKLAQSAGETLVIMPERAPALEWLNESDPELRRHQIGKFLEERRRGARRQSPVSGSATLRFEFVQPVWDDRTDLLNFSAGHNIEYLVRAFVADRAIRWRLGNRCTNSELWRDRTFRLLGFLRVLSSIPVYDDTKSPGNVQYESAAQTPANLGCGWLVIEAGPPESD